jgi:hypothetical protein
MKTGDKRARRDKKLNADQPPSSGRENVQTNHGKKSTFAVALYPPTAKINPSTEVPAKADSVNSPPPWMTVKRLAEEFKDSITEAALRNLIWHAEAYAKYPKSGLSSNHFLPVIVRPPNQRKVLLDRVEFEKWLTLNRTVGRTDPR